jgi:hypothetical protein
VIVILRRKTSKAFAPEILHYRARLERVDSSASTGGVGAPGTDPGSASNGSPVAAPHTGNPSRRETGRERSARIRAEVRGLFYPLGEVP